jgi:hypothetical protein
MLTHFLVEETTLDAEQCGGLQFVPFCLGERRFKKLRFHGADNSFETLS